LPAGAYAARLFADFGAEVIKVEPPAGDPTRSFPPLIATDTSGWFAYLNYGKKSVTSEAVDLDALLRGAHVLIDSTGGNNAHPPLVTVDVSWFGKSGPYRDFKATDAMCRALAGFVQLIGPTEGPPLTLPDYQSAIMGGLAAFIPAMAALHANQSRRWEVSVHEATIALAEYQAIEAWATAPQKRWGFNRFTPTYPMGVYRCKQGFLGITIVTFLVQLAIRRDRSLLAPLRMLAAVGVLSLVASLLTPNGLSLFAYVWRTQFSSQQSSFIAEWQSPDFHMLNMLGFEAMLLLVLIGFAWRRPRLLDVLLVVASAVLALRSWRFIPLFVVPATPVLVWQWSEPWARVRARLGNTRAGRPRDWPREALVMLLALATVAGLGLSAYTLRGQAASTNANYPVAAADWLDAHPQVGTRMFNEYSWGGYLSYRFYPEQNRRVFIYGEAELVGDRLLAQYVEVNQLHSDWMQVLDEYRVDYVLFPANKPLDAALAASRGWSLAYGDSVADIFVRS